MVYTSRITRCRNVFLLLPLFLVLLHSACTCEPEEPSRRVNRIVMENGKVVASDTSAISKETVSDGPFQEKEPPMQVAEPPSEKIHPVLQARLQDPPAGEDAILIITFRDSVQIPRFPVLAIDESHDSRKNRRAVTRAQELIEEIKESRAVQYEALTAELAAYQAEVIETFWLINGVVVRMPMNQSLVDSLAVREDVLYIVPEYTGDEPPWARALHVPATVHPVEDGRTSIASDPYFSYTGGKIGLLDSGIRFTHTQFTQPPSHIDLTCDCVTASPDCYQVTNGLVSCYQGPGFDPTEACGKTHGTSSAAIVTAHGTANGLANDAYRGVTDITLDSYRVFGCSTTNFGSSFQDLNWRAAVRGFEAATEALDGIIIAEIQGARIADNPISLAADNAFDTGAVIIAANGNNGGCPSTTRVTSPAEAHKVIGVGTFDIDSRNTDPVQRCGPALDNRTKPDIQGPTNTQTAGAASDTNLSVFPGTSGAAPYVAGAAALLRNWLITMSGLPCGPDELPCIDPGQVYARLILAGTYANFDVASFNDDNTRGVGPLRLPPPDGMFWQPDNVSVSDGETTIISLEMNDMTAETLAAALWWPEELEQCHNDIDLRLFDPSGTQRASSTSVSSVFERAQVTGTTIAGTWALHIVGHRVGRVPQGETCTPRSPQTVYWDAAAWPNATSPPNVVINEVHADPASGLPGDANGDGSRHSSHDEFVEIVNNSGSTLDISGWTLSDDVGVRHTFPRGTTVPDQCAIVVFGGGTPTGDFGEAKTQTASGGGLELNNGGDTVTLNDGTSDVAMASYGSDGGNNRSLTLNPDIIGGAFVLHTTASGLGGARFSPGTRIDGSQFSGCSQPSPSLIINEVDADTPSTDDAEFVELYDGSAGNTPLDGMVLVFYNGNSDASYAAFDLDGFATDANGFFLMGNAGVSPIPAVIFGDGTLQNGADAVALYFGNASDFPNGTSVTATNLIDALVYDTSDSDDTGLLDVLTPGEAQINEGDGGNKDGHANARLPDGGQALNTATYIQQAPTPGTTNGGPPSTP